MNFWNTKELANFNYPTNTPVHIGNWNGKKVYRYISGDLTLNVGDNNVGSFQNCIELLSIMVWRKSDGQTWDHQGTTSNGSTGNVLALTQKIFPAPWNNNRLICKIAAITGYTNVFRLKFDYISNEDA